MTTECIDFETALEKLTPTLRIIVRSIAFRHPIVGYDDLWQLSLISLKKTLAEWDPTRASLKTFVCRAVKNDLKNAVKKHLKRPKNLSFEEASNGGYSKHRTKNTDILAVESDGGSDTTDECNFYMSQLTVREREIMQFVVNGKTYSEIAELVGLTSGGVHSAIDRIRRRAKAIRSQRAARN